jgi:hypothetical protein
MVEYDLDFLGMCDQDGYAYNMFPISGPLSSNVSSKTRMIISKIIECGRCLIFNGSVYIYVPDIGYWCNYYSSHATRHIADILQFDNITVNYLQAIQPYMALIKQHSNEVVVDDNTICIGIYRLSVSIDRDNDNYLKYYLYSGVAPIQEIDENEISYYADLLAENIISSVCIAPLNSKVIPRLIDCSSRTLIEDILLISLSESQLTTLMWVIGNSLLSTKRGNRIVYLYGKGGNGKSVCINALKDVLNGVCYTLSRDYLGDEAATITSQDLINLLDCKVAIYGDTELRKPGIVSSSFIKMLTGGDQVTTSSYTGIINCSGIFGSNSIFYASKNTKSSWFSRRVVVLHMNRSLTNTKTIIPLFTDRNRIDFVSRCIYTCLNNKFMPISIYDAFASIFGESCGKYTRGVILSSNASVDDCITAGYISSINYDELVDLIGLISAKLVSKHANIPYIKGIKCRIYVV